MVHWEEVIHGIPDHSDRRQDKRVEDISVDPFRIVP